MSAAFEGCLTAAAAACPLEQLSVSGPVVGLPWLPAMRSLRRLRVMTWDRVLPIPSAISALTALDSLDIIGHPIQFSPGASLPPSVTRLEICDRGTQLAQQARSGCCVCVCVCTRACRRPLPASNKHLLRLKKRIS